MILLATVNYVVIKSATSSTRVTLIKGAQTISYHFILACLYASDQSNAN